MKYLLDTHVLLYLGCNELNQVGKSAREIYQNPKTEIFISQISYWEMAIKINIGKLSIPIGLKNLVTLSTQAGIEMIPVKNVHIFHYQTLPRFDNHKDPFDRFIISTAQTEHLPILSSDEKFDLYSDVKRIW